MSSPYGPRLPIGEPPVPTVMQMDLRYTIDGAMKKYAASMRRMKTKWWGRGFAIGLVAGMWLELVLWVAVFFMMGNR